MRYVRVGCTLLLAGLSGLACRAAPGTPSDDHDITGADMRARVRFLAADELGGRGTPSRGLELAAAYIESEFRRIGLEPPAAGFVQRYGLARSEMGRGWSLELRHGRRRVALDHRRDFWGLPWAGGEVAGTARFVGPQPPAEAAEEKAGIFWVVRLEAGRAPRDFAAAAQSAGVRGVLFTFPESLESQLRRWVGADGEAFELGDLESGLPAALVPEDVMSTALTRLGLEPSAESHSGLEIQLAAELAVETTSAPNVVGILPGSDPRLRREYVLLSAHMDGLGVGAPVDGDSIYNGADDNASGTAAVLELAEALSALERPPRRSVIFLTVSGEERGLLGSAWFAEHSPVPLARIVANVNVDMIGRNWEDRIAVIGKPYSSLGSVIDSVAGAHPELGLDVVGDLWPTEGFFFRSDHFNFARRGVPAVFFFNGVHADYHAPSDEADKVNFAKAARVTRLLYEYTLALANADQRPRWNPRARARIVEGSP